MKAQQKVVNVFNELGISHELIEHPRLFTCADYDKCDVKVDGVIFKNLFLRNKNKSAYYLVSLPLEKRADLKLIQERLNESKLSFGSEESLFEKLNITPGAVSILNIINAGKTNVIFIIDEIALECEKIGFHPNDNAATILFAPQDISKVMDKYETNYRFLNISD